MLNVYGLYLHTFDFIKNYLHNLREHLGIVSLNSSCMIHGSVF